MTSMMNPFEGGENGASPGHDHDPDAIHDGHDDDQTILDDLTNIMDGLNQPGDGAERALDVIRNQLINGSKELFLENFELNDLEFFRG